VIRLVIFRSEKHGTQHDSGFVGFEEKFFVIHEMRITHKSVLAPWGVTLPENFTSQIPAWRRCVYAGDF
jgi:hypothetical protein